VFFFCSNEEYERNSDGKAEHQLARSETRTVAPQPDRHDQNYGTYVINHPLPIEVFVAR